MSAVLVAALAVGLAGIAEARPRTTLSQTIVDADGDNRLEPGPGERHVVRQDLGTKTALAKPSPLLFFGQLTDTHVVDEESPLRVEFTDKYGLIFTSAYRPQEGLSAHVANEMVAQMRNTTSPVSGRPIELVMTTGDNTDNSQCNETRWMIDVLDGDTTVNPDSGVHGDAAFTREDLCLQPASPPAAPPLSTCDTEADGLYDGVRGGGEYYEPDRSPNPGADSEDGPGYSPEQSENEREAGRRTAVRDFPGLFERMNEPFRATGFRDVPWFGIFGNHDGLIQGNQPRNPVFESLAVSCTKVTGIPSGDLESARSQDDLERAFASVLAGMQQAAKTGDPGLTTVVPPDPRRRPLRKSEYIAEHFNTSGLPAGHGFTPANVASGQGNYAFAPKPGLRFIVLDTISEHGLEEGNLDDAQFRWLHRELLAADQAKELAVIFAHHSLGTMGQPPASPFAPGDTGGDLSPVVHFGEGPRNSGVVLPCAISDPLLEPTPDETLRCLLLRHRSVVGFVNGHEHANRVTAYERRPGTGPAEGGFWELNTASHIDWPQQSRVLDLVDNHDGTISIVSTILDHAAPPNPGGAPAPAGGQGQSPDGVKRLASISRELSHNDPHGSTGEDGGDARGSLGDRNVELVVRDPR